MILIPAGRPSAFIGRGGESERILSRVTQWRMGWSKEEATLRFGLARYYFSFLSPHFVCRVHTAIRIEKEGGRQKLEE